jgi:hypothetical protein
VAFKSVNKQGHIALVAQLFFWLYLTFQYAARAQTRLLERREPLAPAVSVAFKSVNKQGHFALVAQFVFRLMSPSNARLELKHDNWGAGTVGTSCVSGVQIGQ